MKKLTTGQVAELLQISPSTVLRLIHSGELKAERLTANSQFRVLEDELARYAKAHNVTLLPDQEKK